MYLNLITCPPVIYFLQVKIQKIEKELHLPYLQLIYRDIEDQSYKNIYRLRKQGKTIKMKNGIYQELVAEQRIRVSSKIAIIDKILGMRCKEDISLMYYIENWFTKSITVVNGYIDNQFRGILDILATYMITNGRDISIVTDKKLKRIQKYEVATFSSNILESYGTSNWFTMHKTTKEKVEKYHNKHKRNTRKWKNTYTYKINEILRNRDKKESNWIYVDNTNTFKFDGKCFGIKDNKSYKVKADRQSKMDEVLCILDKHNKYYFYDMSLIEITENVYLLSD